MTRDDKTYILYNNQDHCLKQIRDVSVLKNEHRCHFSKAIYVVVSFTHFLLFF